MLNRIYRLIEPGLFEPVEVETELGSNNVIVRPTHISICNADQRYYQGTRAAEVLAKKLPMALIHEGIGDVVYDPTNTFNVGDCVVMIPNVPNESSDVIAENYLPSSSFCGSGFDGFMQEYISAPASLFVKLPDGVDKNVAAFSELVSVSMHAIDRFRAIAHKKRDVIGIWGDGNLGYITAVLLHHVFPETKLNIFGRTQSKLANFTFADQVYLTNSIPDDLHVDHAFECCGGTGAESAIAQIIDHISPEGAISLLGVSENPPAINTRKVLERGLRLFGSSRSGRRDFESLIELYSKYPAVPEYLKTLVVNTINVNAIKDIHLAFNSDIIKTSGKTIMEWNV